MNEFYYSAEPTSAHAEREIEIEALGVKSRCLTDAGVFSRDGLDTAGAGGHRHVAQQHHGAPALH